MHLYYLDWASRDLVHWSASLHKFSGYLGEVEGGAYFMQSYGVGHFTLSFCCCFGAYFIVPVENFPWEIQVIFPWY